MSLPASPMNRVLGIDLGEARIGVAVSDALGAFAHPLETIDAKKGKPLERLAVLAAREKVTVVILGLPRNMDGSFGSGAEKARAFADRLRAKLGPGIEVRLIDERLTTVAAQRALHDSGRNAKQSRPIIDQVAAQMILQIYLDGETLRREAAAASGGMTDAE